MTKRREGDAVSYIKTEMIEANYDLTRAEGRADFDDELRMLIRELCFNDKVLERHVTSMIRDWRAALFAEASRIAARTPGGGSEREPSLGSMMAAHFYRLFGWR